MDLIARVAQQFEASARSIETAVEPLAAPIAAAIELIVSSLLGNGKLLVCGQGTSLALAQYGCALLTGHLERERPELAALLLAGDATTLSTGMARYTPDEVFAKPLRALGHAGDVLLAIGGAGDIGALATVIDAAHQREITVVLLDALAFESARELLGDQDVHIQVPATRLARAVELQTLALHCLCDGIDCLLMGEES
ncbi:SIS domain-containing protein [Uliginosibacterium sp. H1]|uniref:SIS domain-containing protein n=1 Tax=Uliginosibacterium sp. H1 TaxID=3114757 RepID=UPI002E1741F3|nr:SIS domain-containing protein [Uliginosibacterium sp. H1]